MKRTVKAWAVIRRSNGQLLMDFAHDPPVSVYRRRSGARACADFVNDFSNDFTVVSCIVTYDDGVTPKSKGNRK